MPSNRLFPPLPELPLVDFACLRSFPFRDESSEPSVQPRSSTSSRTVKRIRSQAPTPSPTQTEHHQLPSGEAPKEETFALPPTVIDTLCTTIDGSFPWTAFAAEHNLDPTTLRAHINQQIFFPILSSSPSPIRELAARAENYRIVRSAVAAHISTRELSEARELREYEKMRDKERWQARKKAFKEEM
ncbi:MAG: hypothetical protein LQ352_008349, partial [Teloschistes flavicans]